MKRETCEELLSAKDPSPVQIVNPEGESTFLLLGDHAGNAVPLRLGCLGLRSADLKRHIGWDIGIAELGSLLARELDAVFIRQAYSRLVIDCNRDPVAADAIPETSDGTIVPGNRKLTEVDRDARIAEIHEPYQAAVASEIVRRDATGMTTVLVSLHSFTPVLAGKKRPWHVGVLYEGGNTMFAQALVAELARDGTLVVGENQPYCMDSTDHTVPRHAFASALSYAEIEIRQDRINSDVGLKSWSITLARKLSAAEVRSRAEVPTSQG